jgi:hypothetical protein
MAATDFGVLSLPWRLSSMSCRSSIRPDLIHQPPRLGETGPLSQGVQAGRKTLIIRYMNGMEVRKKRPRGVKKEAEGVQVSPLNPLSISPCRAPLHHRPFKGPLWRPPPSQYVSFRLEYTVGIWYCECTRGSNEECGNDSKPPLSI